MWALYSLGYRVKQTWSHRNFWQPGRELQVNVRNLEFGTVGGNIQMYHLECYIMKLVINSSEYIRDTWLPIWEGRNKGVVVLEPLKIAGMELTQLVQNQMKHQERERVCRHQREDIGKCSASPQDSEESAVIRLGFKREALHRSGWTGCLRILNFAMLREFWGSSKNDEYLHFIE